MKKISASILICLVCVISLLLPSCKASMIPSGETGYYYGQLDDEQKNFYGHLLSVMPEDKRLTVGLLSPLTFEADSPALSEEDKKPSTEEARRIAQGAIDAFTLDHPEYFYIDFSTSYTSLEFTGKKRGDKYIFKVSAIELTIGRRKEFTENAPEAKKELEKALEAFEIKGGSAYERVKYVHDYICDRVRSGSNAGNTGSSLYTAYGALVENISVCQGYAHTFKLLCDREGVENILAVGEAEGEHHIWNLVRMENGKWYAVDTTWDDGDDIEYEYFLVGSTTPVGKENVTFEKDHIAWKDISGTGAKAFTLPELSRDNYAVPDEE